MEIIIDDREKAVVPYLEDASHKYNINYKIQRNDTGDYAIIYKGYILLIIERKTWIDLSASMRDGRKHNIKKLIALREKTGCQIAYLIEGDAYPSPTKKYGRLPIKNLRAHLDHLAFRDGIHMIYSKNQEYTSIRLFELAQNYMSLKETIKEIDDIKENESKKLNVKHNTEEIKELNVKHKIDDISINEQIIRCIPGVGSVISVILSENGISIYSIFQDIHTQEFIASLKYNTGAIIGIEKAKKIMNIKKLLESSSERSNKLKIKILSNIPLITTKTAAKILESFDLVQIIKGEISLDDLSNIQKTEKSRLGNKAAENIYKYLLPDPK